MNHYLFPFGRLYGKTFEEVIAERRFVEYYLEKLPFPVSGTLGRKLRHFNRYLLDHGYEISPYLKADLL